MRRRDFITLFGGTAATWPLAAGAQQPAKMKRFAFVHSAGKVSRMTVSGPPWYRAFFDELSRLGYVEGKNLGVERYSGEGRTDHYLALAHDVVSTHPDLILAVGGRLSLDFKMTTTTIPIVTIVIDPIALGLVASISRPGGNITGVTTPGDWTSLGNVWGCWSRRCQSCRPSVTLHHDHSGRMREVRQRERRLNERALRCHRLYWATPLTRQSMSAPSGRWNKIERAGS